MPIITNKNGKIVRNTGIPTVTTTTIQPNQTNWIDHTKQFATNNNMSYGQSLSNVNNRCQYYDTMIDRSKFDRGPICFNPTIQQCIRLFLIYHPKTKK